jgi:hypothetical protein
MVKYTHKTNDKQVISNVFDHQRIHPDTPAVYKTKLNTVIADAIELYYLCIGSALETSEDYLPLLFRTETHNPCYSSWNMLITLPEDVIRTCWILSLSGNITTPKVHSML